MDQEQSKATIEAVALEMTQEVKTCGIRQQCEHCVRYIYDSCELIKHARLFAAADYRKQGDTVQAMRERLHEEICDMPSLVGADENLLLHMIDVVAKEFIGPKPRGRNV